ncbi:MAG TPA: VanZ family protein [Nitrospiria bacterium]
MAFSALIIVASSIPVQIKPVPIRNWDKWVHAAEYAVLALLWFRAIRGTTLIHDPFKAGLITFLICSSFGFFDEGFQTLIPNRVSDFKDVIADATGSFAAVTLAIIKNRVFKT